MQYARLDIRDGGVYSIDSDDWYISAPDGVNEARYVYPQSNSIVERLGQSRSGTFTVAELGFGTGLNCALTIQDFLAAIGSRTHCQLRYIGFELRLVSLSDMQRIIQSVAGSDAALRSIWGSVAHAVVCGEKTNPECAPGVRIELCCGDAYQLLSGMQFAADVWYLDGFAPGLTPDLWQQKVLQQVTRCSAPAATCSTFTAAGWVRRGLRNCGWQVDRVQGFGRKRHMTIGSLPE